MATKTTKRVVTVGDPVLCDGELGQVKELVTRYASETGKPVQAVRFEGEQFRHFGLVRELHWDDELGAWYLWGRCLGARDQAAVVELRDRGVLVARTTRTPGHPPAGGEHLDLYFTLVQGRPKGWLLTELAQVRRGEASSEELKAAAAAFSTRWHGPHTNGYADPGDEPSETAGRRAP